MDIKKLLNDDNQSIENNTALCILKKNTLDLTLSNSNLKNISVNKNQLKPKVSIKKKRIIQSINNELMHNVENVYTKIFGKSENKGNSGLSKITLKMRQDKVLRIGRRRRNIISYHLVSENPFIFNPSLDIYSKISGKIIYLDIINKLVIRQDSISFEIKKYHEIREQLNDRLRNKSLNRIFREADGTSLKSLEFIFVLKHEKTEPFAIDGIRLTSRYKKGGLNKLQSRT